MEIRTVILLNPSRKVKQWLLQVLLKVRRRCLGWACLLRLLSWLEYHARVALHPHFLLLTLHELAFLLLRHRELRSHHALAGGRACVLGPHQTS